MCMKNRPPPSYTIFPIYEEEEIYTPLGIASENEPIRQQAEVDTTERKKRVRVRTKQQLLTLCGVAFFLLAIKFLLFFFGRLGI